MKWLEISEKTFLENRERAEIKQDDGDCFGMNIEGKFYLYVDNGDKYFLDIYDKNLEDILWDTQFHICIIRWLLDANNFELIEEVVHWINATLDTINFPFLLEDIHYCDYDK